MSVTESSVWPPVVHDWPEHARLTEGDGVDTVRVVPGRAIGEGLPTPKVDDGARLRKPPWEEETRQDLDRALEAARAMRQEAEAFVGWITRAAPRVAADYDLLIEEADARIARLERLAEQL